MKKAKSIESAYTTKSVIVFHTKIKREKKTR